MFLFNLIESMLKFVMEGVLPYDSQPYFNALYFPAQGIMLKIQLVYAAVCTTYEGMGRPEPPQAIRFGILAMMALCSRSRA